MRHIILTRYNVAAFQPLGLPDDLWTAERTALFERWCLPAVEAQTDQDFDWIIFVHPRTHADIVRRLHALMPRRRFDLWFADPFNLDIVNQALRGLCGTDKFIITTRLDNDDAIHSQFIERVKATLIGRPGTWVNFEHGLKSDYRGLYLKRELSNPFLSLAEVRSASGFRTALCKEHGKVGTTEDVINVPNYRAWLQLIHGQNISNRVKATDNPVPLNEVNSLLDGYCPELLARVRGCYDFK